MLIRIGIYLFITLIILPSHARSLMCSQFLKASYELNINDLDQYYPYVETTQKLNQFLSEQSVRKIITLFNTFREGYHDRYNVYVEEVLRINPKLETDFSAFKEATDTFMKHEAHFIELFQKSLLEIPAKKRIHYLRSLSPERLRRDSFLLDSLFGIGTIKLNDFSRFEWESLVNFIYGMDLPIPQQIIALDLNGNKPARFALLMSVMHTDAQVISVLPNAEAVRFYNEIIRKSGILNIRYITEAELKNIELKTDASFIHLF